MLFRSYQGSAWILPRRADAGSRPPRLEELTLRSDPEPERPGSPTPDLEEEEVSEVVMQAGGSVLLGERLSWLRETRLPDGTLPLRPPQGWRPFGGLTPSLGAPFTEPRGSWGETGEVAGRDKGWSDEGEVLGEWDWGMVRQIGRAHV